MIPRILLAAALSVSLSAPASAGDPSTSLLDALDQCDPRTIATTGPRLDVLVALADGRSAVELADVLGGPRRCIGYVSTYGEGESELVFIGGRGSADALGALLWVDRGWWRIAALPLGYMPGTRSVVSRGEVRELFSGIASGGSAGTVGLLGLRIEGASATVTLQMMAGGEIRDIRMLDTDHLYVDGRLTKDRRLTWNTHPAWPYGAQWIFERQGDRFVEVAHRQSLDPYFVWTAFMGALLERDADAMGRFATPQAVSAGLGLGLADRRITPVQLSAPADFLSREHMSWKALPAGIRTEALDGPVWGVFSQYDARGRTLLEVEARFDRAGDAWIVTELRQIVSVDLFGPQLIP